MSISIKLAVLSLVACAALPVRAQTSSLKIMSGAWITTSPAPRAEHFLLKPQEVFGNSWKTAAAGGFIFLSPDNTETPLILKFDPVSGEQVSLISPFNGATKKGIALAACRRRNAEEIALVPEQGVPHVLRYSIAGKLLSPGFLGKGKQTTELNRLTCSDINGDGIDEITVASRSAGTIALHTYDAESGKNLRSFSVPDWGPFSFSLGRIDLGGDGVDELILAAGGMMRPEVRLYRTDGTRLNAFEVLPAGFIGGVAVAGADLDGDKKEELIIGAGPGGGQLRILDGFGKEKLTDKFFPLGTDARHGIFPLPADHGLLILSASHPVSDEKTPKSIIIDVASQRMSILTYGHESARFPISTGTWSTPTPVGKHAVANKITRAYSRRYGLYMPWWMAIVPSGAYGIHELPEWPNGTKEGEAHLGTRRSHGCIRLGIGPARAVYAWAEVGIPVTVQ